MHTPPRSETALTLSTLPFLFRRYVTGQINQTSWEQFMHLFDAEAITSDERVGLAAFFRDALAEMESEEMEWPALGEVEELLTYARAA